MSEFNLKVVRQPEGSKICTICCVGMITGNSVNQLLAWYGVDRTSKGEKCWKTKRARKALADLDWAGIAFELNHEFESPPTAEIDIGNHVGLVGVLSKSLKLSDGNPAEHCVVYCPERKMVLDPQHDEPQDLEGYTVAYWEPLTKLLPYEGPEL